MKSTANRIDTMLNLIGWPAPRPLTLRVRIARAMRTVANRLDNGGLPIQAGYSCTLSAGVGNAARLAVCSQCGVMFSGTHACSQRFRVVGGGAG